MSSSGNANQDNESTDHGRCQASNASPWSRLLPVFLCVVFLSNLCVNQTDTSSLIAATSNPDESRELTLKQFLREDTLLEELTAAPGSASAPQVLAKFPVRNVTLEPGAYANLTEGAFVHLGKTGGSTLTKFLRYGCHAMVKVGRKDGACPNHNVQNETVTSLKTKMYYHCPDFPKLPTVNHEYYIVTLRDPYDRTRSSFVYSHPANDKALKTRGWMKYDTSIENMTKCVDTLENFVTNLGDGNRVHEYSYPYPPHERHQQDCKQFARALFDHKVNLLVHLYWSFQHIYELMKHDLNQSVIFGVRMEHMVQDWNTTNLLLGETQDTTKLFPEKKYRDTTGLVLPVPNELSEEGRIQLCRALRRAYVRYLEILHSSVNLTPEDIEASLELARSNCGDQLEFL